MIRDIPFNEQTFPIMGKGADIKSLFSAIKYDKNSIPPTTGVIGLFGVTQAGKSTALFPGIASKNMDYIPLGENVTTVDTLNLAEDYKTQDSDYITGAPASLDNLKLYFKKCRTRIIIIDSVTALYLPELKTPPAMKGGFDPAHAAMMFELQAVARELKILMFVVYNTLTDAMSESAFPAFRAKIRQVAALKSNYKVEIENAIRRKERSNIENIYFLRYFLDPSFTTKKKGFSL